MPKYRYTVWLYTESGEIEAEDEVDARHQAKEYVSQQFWDALSQAEWAFVEVEEA